MTDRPAHSTPAFEYGEWPEFIMPWDDTLPGPTDMSFLLEKPAGARGYIQVVDGHLADGGGKRWRMWSVNLCANMPMPPMAYAPTVARRLSKYGINCLRLHSIDHRWPNGLLLRAEKVPPVATFRRGPNPDTQSTRVLDPEAMARLDYFVFCCKREGVYVNLNLNVARRFSVGDDLVQGERVGWGKGATLFNQRLIDLQKEHARHLLEHRNPFTGLRYADEPAVALIELINENSLTEYWFKGALQGVTPDSNGVGWSPISEAYAHELDARWNAWLARRYADRAALENAWEGGLGEYECPVQGTVRRLAPDEFESAAPRRFRDELEFYMHLEKGFFVEMAAYLRELGARQLILSTSDHNHAWSGLPLIEAQSALDIVDGHSYWSMDWESHGVLHAPMVDDPDRSMIGQLSRTAVKGKPYIVSECNEPFPNDYAAEFIPLIAAYGLLQDWDGISLYDYDGTWIAPYWQGQEWQRPHIASFFEVGCDPVKMPQLAQGALTFLRGDVQAARQTVERTVSHEWALDSVRRKLPNTHAYWLDDLPGRLALVHRTVLADFHADEVRPAKGEVALPVGAIVSDTGELTWKETPGEGRVTINAPRCQAMIGRAGEDETDNVRLELRTPFAAVQVSSLDARPISLAARLLVVAGARVANKGMRWADTERGGVLEAWGDGPTVLEPVVGTLTLRGLQDASAAWLLPLDGHGQPMGEKQEGVVTERGFCFELTGTPATPWYLVQVSR